MVADLSIAWSLSCQQEDCLAKMIYSGRKLLMGLAVGIEDRLEKM